MTLLNGIPIAGVEVKGSICRTAIVNCSKDKVYFYTPTGNNNELETILCISKSDWIGLAEIFKKRDTTNAD